MQNEEESLKDNNEKNNGDTANTANKEDKFENGRRPLKPQDQRPMNRSKKPSDKSDKFENKGPKTYVQKERPKMFYYKKKVCKLCGGKDCKSAVNKVEYKDIDILSRFVTEKGKILPRRITGVCAKGQRRITKAIKRARTLCLLPFTARD